MLIAVGGACIAARNLGGVVECSVWAECWTGELILVFLNLSTDLAMSQMKQQCNLIFLQILLNLVILNTVY